MAYPTDSVLRLGEDTSQETRRTPVDRATHAPARFPKSFTACATYSPCYHQGMWPSQVYTLRR
jgi:hypothetical protein